MRNVSFVQQFANERDSMSTYKLSSKLYAAASSTVRWRLPMSSCTARYLSRPKALSSSSHKDLDKPNLIWGESEETTYQQCLKDREIALNKRLTASNRFQKISEREDRSELSRETILSLNKGKHFIHHRGCVLMKSPQDLVIFQELLWNLKPATIIELGSCAGGSALWMADMLQLMEVNSKIYSMDIDLSNLQERVKKLKPNNLQYLEGNSHELEKTFTEDMLRSLSHPWLITEDTHTNVYGIMKHFEPHMQAGDYFVIEDVNPDLPNIIGYGGIYDAEFVPIGPGMLQSMKKFLNEYSDKFAVDSFYTDLFGYNGTWNMNGFIRRM